MLSRSVTNAIRFVMDECLPPIIRDNRLFMYPFYRMAYRSGDIAQIMNFKRDVYGWDKQQYNKFYRELDSLSRHRDTDLNQASIEHILSSIPAQAAQVLDVGCGSGHLLEQMSRTRPELALTGSDVAAHGNSNRNFELVLSDVGRLPFADRAFDFVSCCHTLEHIIELPAALAELRRVTRGRLVIVVPRQRYYFYTLDEHVNFFPQIEPLVHALGISEVRYSDVGGDWLLTADIE